MNGIIYKAYISTLCPMSKSKLVWNWSTWRWETIAATSLTSTQINHFIKVTSLQDKKVVMDIIKRALIKAQFVYDDRLFKQWKYEFGAGGLSGCLQLTCFIYFEDTYNEGNVLFMKYINEFMKHSERMGVDIQGRLKLVKSYGKIY